MLRRLNKKTGFLKAIGSEKLYDFCFFTRDQEEYWLQRLNAQRYDAVIAVAGKYSVMLGRIAKRLCCKTIGWQHNAFAAYHEMKGEYFWAQDALFKKYLSQLDYNVVLTENDAELYRDKLGVDSIALHNPKSFVSVQKAELNEKQMIAAGMIRNAKGFDLLVLSCVIFFQKHPDWQVVIYGDGPSRKKLERSIEQAGLTGKLILAGVTQQIAQEMLKSSVFLLPSRWEGMPKVVLEAMETGLPIIAYGIPAVQSLMTDGVEGIVVPCFDTKAFAEAMIQMADDIQRRKKLAKNAIEKSRSFDVQVICQQWYDILR